MGYAVSHVAFRGVSPKEALSRLEVKPTGKTVDFVGGPITAGALPGGWYAVFFNHRAFREFTAKDLATLSTSAEVAYGFVEEHVMASHASLWRNGCEVWSVSHCGEEGDVNDLRVSGETPKELQAIRGEKRALQEGDPDGEVDYGIEVPTELTKNLLGFSVGRGVIGDEVKKFEVLERKRKGFLSMFR